jgi:hypothetical protein
MVHAENIYKFVRGMCVTDFDKSFFWLPYAHFVFSDTIFFHCECYLNTQLRYFIFNEGKDNRGFAEV